jgi:hypothetical protein
MANKDFAGISAPVSLKQCLLAKELHYECLGEIKTENNYLCPDTWEGFKRWCPQDVRIRLRNERKEELYNRDIWAKHN